MSIETMTVQCSHAGHRKCETPGVWLLKYRCPEGHETSFIPVCDPCRTLDKKAYPSCSRCGRSVRRIWDLT